MRFAITGLGVVSPAGVGVDALFEAFAAGPRRPPSLSTRRTVPARGWATFGAKQKISPRPACAACPRLTQMAIVAAKQALGENPFEPTRIGVVLGTGLGTLDETHRLHAGLHRGAAPKPALAASSFPIR